MGISGFIGIVMGRMTDKYNARVVVAIGMLVGTASYILMSTMDHLWEFYLYFGLGAGIYAGSAYTPVTATISKWFAEKRTFALGIALMGIVVGQMVLSPIVAWIVDAHGWRSAYLVLAGVAFVCAVPAVLLIGRKRVDAVRGGGSVSEGTDAGSGAPTQLPGVAVKEAVRTAPFWMLVVSGFVLAMGFYMMASHIVPYATDVGMSTTAAALILTVSSVGGMAGTLLAWWITVRLGSKRALATLLALEALAIFLFILSRSAWEFYVVAILLGFSFSAGSPVRMGMMVPLFGLRSIGTILGLASLAFSLGGIAGPFMAGYVFDLRDSYDMAFLIAAILLSVGALTVCVFGSHRKKQ
jgi:MFS family permease